MTLFLTLYAKIDLRDFPMLDDFLLFDPSREGVVDLAPLDNHYKTQPCDFQLPLSLSRDFWNFSGDDESTFNGSFRSSLGSTTMLAWSSDPQP